MRTDRRPAGVVAWPAKAQRLLRRLTGPPNAHGASLLKEAFIMAVKQKAAPRKTAAGTNLTAFVCDIKPGAKEVYLVGDFNDWDPSADRMVKRKGVFQKLLQLEPGEYQYKFLVDGQWHADPSAMTQVPNAFGTLNSVVRVRSES
jgi:1,4-alpha-glucan branching enzyme